jgi:hypothetical protein
MDIPDRKVDQDPPYKDFLLVNNNNHIHLLTQSPYTPYTLISRIPLTHLLFYLHHLLCSLKITHRNLIEIEPRGILIHVYMDSIFAGLVIGMDEFLDCLAKHIRHSQPDLARFLDRICNRGLRVKRVGINVG